MAAEEGHCYEENDTTRNKQKPESSGAMMGSEPAEQQEEAQTHVPKNTVSEPCMTAMENYLLAHFFFIFAASFILGVIFLHSSLTFWSWQVYDDVAPYTAPPTEVQELFPHHQDYQDPYRKDQQSFNDVITSVISPNMTISLIR